MEPLHLAWLLIAAGFLMLLAELLIPSGFFFVVAILALIGGVALTFITGLIAQLELPTATAPTGDQAVITARPRPARRSGQRTTLAVRSV